MQLLVLNGTHWSCLYSRLLTGAACTLGYSLELLVLALDLLACHHVLLDVLVLGVDNDLTDLSEATVAADGEEGRVKVGVVLTQVLLLLGPGGQRSRSR